MARVKVVLEQVPRRADASLGVFTFRGTAFTSPYHLHPEVELTVIEAGAGRLLIGDRQLRFAAGDVILQGPGLPHAYQSEKPGRAQARWVQFDAAWLCDAGTAWVELQGVRELLGRAARGLRFRGAVAKAVRRQLAALRRRRGAARAAGFLATLAVLAEAGGEPLASAGYVPAPAAGAGKVARLLALLEEGWTRTLSLAEAGRALGLHPQSVSRLCRAALGRSFRGLVAERRLAEAARRLIETDARVTEVAFACGFANLANFNRQFRRHYGASPVSYRRAIGARGVDMKKPRTERGLRSVAVPGGRITRE
jgi:AraC-like DNA-binding protein